LDITHGFHGWQVRWRFRNAFNDKGQNKCDRQGNDETASKSSPNRQGKNSNRYAKPAFAACHRQGNQSADDAGRHCSDKDSHILGGIGGHRTRSSLDLRKTCTSLGHGFGMCVKFMQQIATR
jgi:hypothetical protein